MSEIEKPNDQYNLTRPGSLAERIGGHVRGRMFTTFMERLSPRSDESVLDVGVTGDRQYSVSNYFEELYPFKANITAAGLDDASYLELTYPGMRFVQANALDLPFHDGEFDLVHSSAVLEHVGSAQNQARMIAECLRVARRAVFVTTPNRWFPVEFHTQLPLVHWLPSRLRIPAFQQLGCGFFAKESNLNLTSYNKLAKMVDKIETWKFEILRVKLVGFTSNLLLLAYREAGGAGEQG